MTSVSTAIRPRSGRPPWWVRLLPAVGLAGIVLALGVATAPRQTHAASIGAPRVHVTLVSEVRREAPGTCAYGCTVKYP